MNKTLSKKALLTVFALVVTLVATRFLFLHKSAPQTPLSTLVATKVFSSEKSVFLNGQIVAKNLVRISAPLPGIVQKTFVAEGQAVTHGELLLTLESQAAESALEQARLELELANLLASNAKTKLERSQELYNEELISLEQLQTDILESKKLTLLETLAQVKQNQAASQAEWPRIKSPSDGTILTCKAAVGEKVCDGAPLFELMPKEPSWQAVFMAQEFDLKHLAVGKEGVLNIYSQDFSTPAKIRFVSPVAKQKGTFCSFDVFVDLPNEIDKTKLYSGLCAQFEVPENA